MLIPVAVHLHFVEDIFTEENLPFFSGCFAGLAIILSAFTLGLVQEAFIPSGEGRINAGNLLTVAIFLSFAYLGTYLGLAFVAEYLKENIFVISDLAKEIRAMDSELRFLLFQSISIGVTYASSILTIIFVRYIAQSE